MKREPEIYRLIPDYPDYEVSSYGNIMSYKLSTKGIIRKLKINRGYYGIILVNEKGRKQLSVSRIVYQVFNGDLISGMVIDHDDNDPLNNYYNNLIQITPRLNSSKDQKNKTSIYTGVSLSKKRKEAGNPKYWLAQITIKIKSMKKKFKTPLWLKLLISTTTCGIAFFLITLLLDNTWFTLVVIIIGVLVMIWNMYLIIKSHFRVDQPKDSNKNNTPGPWSI